MGERLAGRAEHGDAALLRLRTMKVGDPEIALGVERTTIAATASQVMEDFCLAEHLILFGQTITQDLLALRFDHVEELAPWIDVEPVGKRQSLGHLCDRTIRLDAKN